MFKTLNKDKQIMCPYFLIRPYITVKYTKH